MAKRKRFNRDDFEDANKNRGGFPEVENGMYVVSVEKAEFKPTTNGAEQVAFGFQIDAEEEYGGQYVWYNQTTVNIDGETNMRGLQAFNDLAYKLSEGMFDVDDFMNHYDNEEEDKVMQRFLGTKLRAKITKVGEWQGNPKYKIEPRTILENTYSNGAALQKPRQESKTDELDLPEDVKTASAPSTPAVATANEDKEPDVVDSEDGQPVTWTTKEGREMVGKIISHVTDPNDPKKGFVKVRQWNENLTVEGKKEFTLNAEDVFALNLIVEEDEEILEEEEPESKPSALKVGGTVKYKWNGSKITGEVHAIDEDNGIIKVKAKNDKGQTVARKISMDDIEAVAPF